MTIDKVIGEKKATENTSFIENSRIVFPYPISPRDVESMLMYVAHYLPADIDYRIDRFIEIRHEKKDVKKDAGSATIGGIIKSKNRKMAFDNFECKPSEKDYTKIQAMQFAIVPGLDEEDYLPEITELWHNTRKVIFTYFLKKRKKITYVKPVNTITVL